MGKTAIAGAVMFGTMILLTLMIISSAGRTPVNYGANKSTGTMVVRLGKDAPASCTKMVMEMMHGYPGSILPADKTFALKLKVEAPPCNGSVDLMAPRK